jgi:CHAD domain-containing protein
LQAALDATQQAREVHDELHRARKAAKRYRYAVELAEPALGGRASSTIASLKALQELLGDHQDAAVAAGFLRDVGVRAGTENAHNGFTYGVLYAAERQRLAATVGQLRTLLDKGMP